MSISVGTAGWGIPREVAEHFTSDGSALSRYASVFSVAEINSSFHRAHRLSTWERWRDAVPDGFRFSVKVPKLITHTHKLVDVAQLVDDFVAHAGVLGDKLAILLVQLPPKLEFEQATAQTFFEQLADRSDAAIACEPRHPSWFTPAADAMLQQLRVARVAADPAICDAASVPGGWAGLAYWRLHGSPVVYRSSYRDRIADYASRLQAGPAPEVWCIFDNTASSAGAGDALAMLEHLRS
jgi:uncharacterized protein YecE (DUF72 family)